MNIRNAISESVLCRRQKAWDLVQCKARQDCRAEENLQRPGYACARPVYGRVRIVRGQTRTVQKTLCLGYLPISLPADTDWPPLRPTRVVSHIVSSGERPLSVANSIVLKLQHCDELMENSHVKCSELTQRFEPACTELDTMMTVDGEERVTMLVNYSNRQEQSTGRHYT
ncbi:transcription/translation regulatory transformer protein RfaH [Pseudomonas sp. Z3-6]